MNKQPTKKEIIKMVKDVKTPQTITRIVRYKAGNPMFPFVYKTVITKDKKAPTIIAINKTNRREKRMMATEKKEKEESKPQKNENPLKSVVSAPPLTILKYTSQQSKETSIAKKEGE